MSAQTPNLFEHNKTRWKIRLCLIIRRAGCQSFSKERQESLSSFKVKLDWCMKDTALILLIARDLTEHSEVI